ncbi:MAG: hypothetical protein M1457_01825 [bacterium]|nr:hypothetical protein [bacterium]
MTQKTIFALLLIFAIALGQSVRADDDDDRSDGDYGSRPTVVVTVTPVPAVLGRNVTVEGTVSNLSGYYSAYLTVYDARGSRVVDRRRMTKVDSTHVTYTFTISSRSRTGTWRATVNIVANRRTVASTTQSFQVVSSVTPTPSPTPTPMPTATPTPTPTPTPSPTPSPTPTPTPTPTPSPSPSPTPRLRWGGT